LNGVIAVREIDGAYRRRTRSIYMKKTNVTTTTTPTNSTQVLLRETGKVLKVKTGLKAGQKVREAA
jgi:hypothetical protein